MDKGGRSVGSHRAITHCSIRRKESGVFRAAPLAHAVALILATGAWHSAHAQQAFSSAWFAAKGAAQSSAAATGYLPNGMPASSLTNPAQQKQQANQQLQTSLNNLAIMARGIAAQQAAQAAARLAATNGAGVPDGLTDGGLKVDTDSLTKGWLNANAPTQTTVDGKTVVAIQQTADKAILNWETFNIGKNTILSFLQQPSWAVLNRINDPLARPSQIQGQIKGDGTVMIVNRNGVIFSGSSQVDTRNLVAAAAAISDSQFTASGLYGANGTTPSFTDANGKLIVEAGARISTAPAASVTQGGGYVLLLGSEVSNAGTISTPKGQAALAAGDSFIIRKGYGTDANAMSTTRGNEISPQFINGSTAGKVVNTGLLTSPEGDVTLAGRDVQQNGVAIATTTVNTRGTIHLLNSASDAQGSVTLGSGSYTAVLIDDDGTTTALNSQRDALIADSAKQDALRASASSGVFDNLSKLSDRRDQSRVEIVSGGNINFADGSLTLASGGQIAASATKRAFAASGSTLDVSGAVGVSLPMSSNGLLVNIQGNELRDAPVARDSGTLSSSNVWIDTSRLIYVPAGTGGYASDRWYTAGGLLEVGGYLANQGHRVGEWAAQGGALTLGGAEVITQTGSAINISGGTVNVQTGYVNVSWLKGSDGQLYRVDTAPANLSFDGVYKGFESAHARWGNNTTEYYYNPLIGPQHLLQNGYTSGRDAGSLQINASTAVLEGDVMAAVYNGPNQTVVRITGATDGYKLGQTTAALAGSLVLGQYSGVGRTGTYASDVLIGDIGDVSTAMAAGDVLDATRLNTVWLNAARLNGDQLGAVDMVTSGQITVRQPLQLANGGRLSLVAPVVDIEGDLTARGGTVKVSNLFLPDGQLYPIALTTADNSARLTLATGKTIDVRGLWVNTRMSQEDTPQLAYLNGGNVILDSTGDLTVAAGSVIDVSSGGAMLATGKTRGGTGGNVTLIAGDSAGNVGHSLGTLMLDGTIKAYGVNGGGKLTLSTPDSILIGSNAALAGGELAAGTAAAVAVKLAQPLTIAVGQPLPIELVQRYTSLLYDVPVQVDVKIDGLPVGATLRDWVIPPGIEPAVRSSNGFLVYYSAGSVLPAGSVVANFSGAGDTIRAGTVIPSGVFPNGIPVKPFQYVFAAGSVQAADMTYPVGFILPTGTVLPQTVAVTPVPMFNAGTSGNNSSFFSAGFSSYDLNGGQGVRVDNGVTINPVMPVYRFSTGSVNAASGSDPAVAMELWTPPLFAEHPQGATLMQRGGVSLALRSTSTSIDGNPSGAAVVVAPHASVIVDPGQSITLDAFGQITVDGSLTARGGSISLINEANPATAPNFDASGVNQGVSIWIGEAGRLDVSGLGYAATDILGRTYGTLRDGGAIKLSGNTSFLVLRPGAELNADGAALAVDASTVPGQSAGAVGSMTRVSNGGSIALSSLSGLVLDGNLHAVSGGSGASGGDLNIALVTPIYPDLEARFPSSVVVPSVMTVSQSRPAAWSGSDPASAASLPFGQAAVSVDMVRQGGFSSLSLSSGDFMIFSSDVSLSLDRSLSLNAGAFTSGPRIAGGSDPAASPGRSNVRLAAPYMSLSGTPVIIPDGNRSGSIGNPGAAESPTTATFEADARLIDVQGSVVFSADTSYYDSSIYAFVRTPAPGFRTVRLVSQGDIRFLPTPGQQRGTTLITSWDMDLEAAQIYPATNAVANIVAGQRNSAYEATLTIGRTTATLPDVPLSVFGSLYLSAPVIEQGGIVRAPLGQILMAPTAAAVPGMEVDPVRIELLPGSLTSVSMAGLQIPYGGTVDGVSYTYNGAAITPLAAGGIISGGSGLSAGVKLQGQSVAVDSGAVIDLSGGGQVLGAGFVSGRGGSVDILNTPLVNANPTATNSKTGDKVYAIVPGYASAYAPVAPDKGAGDPAVGQQITIGAGVPGLPAGTYTLLPSTYALLPGAYRVEIGATGVNVPNSAAAIGNGSYLVSGYTGIANTSIVSQLPSTVLVTSGTAVRRYSQYNEQGYSDFFQAQAAQFGSTPALLPSDGKALLINLINPANPGAGSDLRFDGTALFQAAAGGVAGQAVVTNVGEITTGARTAGFANSSVSADDLSAIGAPRLNINGYAISNNGLFTFQSPYSAGSLYVRDGVMLKAGEIYLVGGDIVVGNDVTLSTIGQGAVPYDSASTGMGYSAGINTVLGLSNGSVQFVGSANSTGSISIGANSRLYAEGTLALATNGASGIDSTARFGARNIVLAAGTLNIGDAGQVAASGSSGLLFNQAVLNTLLQGDAVQGVPTLRQLTLSAANSINLFGSNGLDTRGTGVDIALNSPAIYGYGGGADRAVIAADHISWSVVSGANPPAVNANGPGTGLGALELVAREIDLGQFVSLDNTKVNRTIYGFNDVNFTASERIVSAGNGSLYVYQAPSSQSGAVFGQSGSGGNLTLSTPLLTGTQKSIMAYTAGGALNVVAPAGATPSTATSTIAGAEIDLNGDSVSIGSTILLPSGKLAVNATHDISLNSGNRIDLAGQASQIQNATIYGFGGTAIFNSAQGSFTQAAGATIDVSALNANAGSITVDARNGVVSLNGALQGRVNAGYLSGDFSASAASFADFAGLNALLTQGGFFDARSFDQRTGDLVIGDGVKAHQVNISVDGGGLTVNGTIDASGTAPGTIRLSAGNGLTLASTAVLDAHGTRLQTDSYGQAIEAKNRGHVELTAAAGTLTLSPGATIDLSTPGGASFGDVVLNAQRTAETSGDIAVDARGPLTIRGVNSIALNAFWTYDLAAGTVITQGSLDTYDTASTSFINAALGNTALGARTAGLSAYDSAYHLRPGVQITSSGDLSTSGDIDLAKYRYGPNANRDPASAAYGAGEPMALVVRAGGNLTVTGSISDGFRASQAGAPTYLAVTVSMLSTDTAHFGMQGTSFWKLQPGNVVAVSNPAGWTVPTLLNGAPLPVPFRPMGVNGTMYASGSVIPYGTQLTRLLIPVGKEADVVGMSLQTDPGTPAAPATSARASMLAAGSMAAFIRLAAGADLLAADQRMLQTAQALNDSGNLTLNDAAYNGSLAGTFFSVLRTGTGGLDLLAAGSFSEATPYGVYTAGTQSAPILAADGSNPYNLVGTVTGGLVQAWYPEHGGDVLLMAQQDVSGNIQIADNSLRYVASDLTSNWLSRQAGSGISPDPTAWWINFGALAKTYAYASGPGLIGFQGIGTMGGGNLTVIAGRNAGVMTSAGNTTSTGLDLAVASTGRVLADGTLVQTGGGDLTLKVGGVLNGRTAVGASNYAPDYYGTVTGLRGNIDIASGAIGVIAQANSGLYWKSYDPRSLDAATIKRSMQTPGPTVTPGDGAVTVATRGDLVFGGAGDAGMGPSSDVKGMYYTMRDANGMPTVIAQGANTQFTLWTPSTAIQLYSAGGDATPMTGATPGSLGFYPGSLSVVAANGNIRVTETSSAGGLAPVIELIPSPIGQLQLLAAGTIYGSGATVSMSGADMASLATPLRPYFMAGNRSNAAANGAIRDTAYNPLAFGEDTVTGSLHAQGSGPALVYAGIDIDDLSIGRAIGVNRTPSSGFKPTTSTWYVAAKPFEVIAGRDIVGTGALPSVFLNLGASDITLLQAGRDILYQSVNIVGPGLLQMQAGRNFYQGYYGSLNSVGDIVHPSNTSGGADISVLAGVGANGPDYAGFARLYFDAAKQMSGGTALADSGKVVHAYNQELVSWLQERFGYTGTAGDALAYFLALPTAQQGVFVRQVYFKELLLGGREYNDPASPRHGSYLRGRVAIATLFPATGYNGAITMFSSVTGSNTINGVTTPVTSDASVRTNFGGSIQMLNPGGRTLVGVEGVTPGASAGVVTQGQGDIQLYSKDSILLGLSRIMTTFGGNIQAWSSNGDINAGRGAKTTVLYTPPKRVYDNVGDVTLSPQVPSSGAGIATLAPIPEVPAGDIDLIAPLGTIDAGEAGIRVSGNVNLAALQVVNAANIQVQGKAVGIPMIAAVNVGALTNASAAASSAATAAQESVQRARNEARQALPSIFTVRVLGFGNDTPVQMPSSGSAPAQSSGAASRGDQDMRLPVQVMAPGLVSEQQRSRLTGEEKRLLGL
ncbi:filamentous haemagglutinin family protein [Herbaspirillum sp. RV1423]|uniref:filamentous haemagglutinin family protein n=1 Tax=Herbaspirillum sp. RV1423 TaxID=1443993 RepID=UPI0004B45167|nr:filamentous haemagglutinin family protein [Herbaspirillum sp. RV1423]